MPPEWKGTDGFVETTVLVHQGCGCEISEPYCSRGPRRHLDLLSKAVMRRAAP